MNPLPLDTFGWRSAGASGKGKKWPMCLCQRVPLEASRSRLAGATGTSHGLSRSGKAAMVQAQGGGTHAVCLAVKQQLCEMPPAGFAQAVARGKERESERESPPADSLAAINSRSAKRYQVKFGSVLGWCRAR
ncbi:predicted protein [Coccidioides posadasii str. Silveira]|uniref:Predicted protein n=2 Tax=Coccidioides posadasii TaxID=199306 RepID=E9D5S2_COCPS|nr:predicted protein [Coccidioides posadasii str. Silveira]KMM66348.1 hypothetical protein CPAG_02687 [Coccidioides posadasii RMSCC 3488]